MENKHAMLNSLVMQISTDADCMRGTAGLRGHLTADQIKLLRDTASAILHKIERYEELQK